MPQCRICSTSFIVPEQVKPLLHYFDAPEPTCCFDHFLQQHFAYRNERHLYRRTCELCGDSILAMYAPESYVHVYCHRCWYSDNWDALQYGKKYDPSRSFFEQWFDLVQQVPHFNLWQVGESTNSEYANYIRNSKDSYLSFSNLDSEGSVYNSNIDFSRDCADSFQVSKSELLYDCVFTKDSYHCAFLTRAEQCTDCYFGRDLQDCQSCFGCVNLRHKKFYWYNKPLSQEEYQQRLQAALQNRKAIEKYRKQFEQFAQQFPVEAANIRQSSECSGNEIAHSKNVTNGFNIVELENGADLYRAIYAHDIYRSVYIVYPEYVYQSSVGPKMHHSCGLYMCSEVGFSAYSYICNNSDELFGCVGLRQKKFCILNVQYSEEEYRQLRQQIIQDMKKHGEWGEFFPIHYSPHAYNDTFSQDFFPMNKEEVLKKGWRWQENQGGTFGKETVQPEHIPNTIDKIGEEIVKQVLRCTRCNKNYRIQKKELEILELHHLPIPLECQDCRFAQRLKRSYKPKLYERQCMCDRKHHAHVDSSCSITIASIYAPNCPEIVYCKECYQAEVI
ncbi:MAG TPA: hypothetical protein VJB65_00120 [Patescibacteria group bacterium]|nr:hypothetical protein [Patescibacteria group bacterium]